jgi:NAD(P)-dependent dehydrogenase (short-subunit alcohol dehydrogenase family)
MVGLGEVNVSESKSRPVALITGAAGGMGRACARLLGVSHDLLLTDAVGDALKTFADELSYEGYRLQGAHAGDIASSKLLDALTGELGGSRRITLIHTAGLSPSQADWRKILEVNLLGTVRLLDAVEPLLTPGSSGVLIASIASYFRDPPPDAIKLLRDPFAADFFEKIEPIIQRDWKAVSLSDSHLSYAFTKFQVVRLAEARATRWGQSGARINSISPGVIFTPMSRLEMAQPKGTIAMSELAPSGRPGLAMDIALAARYLASEDASFITGTDLRVDGGAIASLRQKAKNA